MNLGINDEYLENKNIHKLNGDNNIDNNLDNLNADQKIYGKNGDGFRKEKNENKKINN